MIFNSKKEQKKEIVAIVAEVKETIKELNQEVLRIKKKKSEIGKNLSDKQAELIYYRSVLKDCKEDLKGI
jgi:uncharacterized coiled-coil DUF342 family protein